MLCYVSCIQCRLTVKGVCVGGVGLGAWHVKVMSHFQVNTSKHMILWSQHVVVDAILLMMTYLYDKEWQLHAWRSVQCKDMPDHNQIIPLKLILKCHSLSAMSPNKENDEFAKVTLGFGAFNRFKKLLNSLISIMRHSAAFLGPVILIFLLSIMLNKYKLSLFKEFHTWQSGKPCMTTFSLLLKVFNETELMEHLKAWWPLYIYASMGKPSLTDHKLVFGNWNRQIKCAKVTCR